MENINIKNFSLFSVSVTLLFICCAGTFYIWKSETEKASNQRKFENEKILNKIQEQVKREKMDEAYIDEFTSNWVFSYENKDSASVSVILEDLDKIEASMRIDGYNFSEIKEIRHKGWKNAQIEMRNKKKL